MESGLRGVTLGRIEMRVNAVIRNSHLSTQTYLVLQARNKFKPRKLVKPVFGRFFD